MPLQKMTGTAWVTGAGKGIGRALALRLAKRGWTVAVSARTEADLQSLADEACGLPGKIHPFALDIVDPVATAATVSHIRDAIGPLDLAVLNAGTHRSVSAQGFDAAVVRSLVDVNLMGTVNFPPALRASFFDGDSAGRAFFRTVHGNGDP